MLEYKSKLILLKASLLPPKDESKIKFRLNPKKDKTMFMISINKETNITPKTIFIGLNFEFVMAVYSKYKNKRL